MIDLLDPTMQRLMVDLPFYGQHCLTIRDKKEQFVPLVLNRAQRILHDVAEQQLREKGWVRIMVLKGRQFGISTYIAARYYRRTTLRPGVNTFILSHEQVSATALFNIVDRFQRHNPLAPHVGISNVKELVFDRLDSSYAVATAGGKPSGRSRTISLFHGSEAAFWTNAPAHFAASVQAVPLEQNTEIFLETTSDGPQGAFYERWQDAVNGIGDYIAVFLPCDLDDGYVRPAPPDFALDIEKGDGDDLSEAEYAVLHGLSLDRMFWRRNKTKELGSKITFQREYPMTPEEAWVHAAEHEPFISPVLVLRAMKRQGIEGAGPLVLGVDPASLGGDRFSVCARRGSKVEWVRFRNKVNTIEATEWLRSLIDELAPARANIDLGHVGQAIVTNLKALGPSYDKIVRGVNFGGTSQFKMARPNVPGPFNRRAEMWDRCREWLEMEEGVSLPDLPALASDLVGPTKKARLSHDWLLESKEDMKSRGVRSPDLADSLVLTFASNEFFKDYKDAPRKQSFGNLDDRRPAPQVLTEIAGLSTGWMG